MKFKVLNNEPLQFHNQSGNLTGTILVSASGDMIIRPESGSGNAIIIGDQTTTGNIEFGTAAAPVNLKLLGGGTITSNTNTLYIGQTGDTVRINNAIFTQSLQITGSLRVSGSAYATYFVGDGSGLTNVTALSASYATTASYVKLVAGPNITINQVGDSFEITGSAGGSGNAFPYTGSAQITGSLGITGSLNVTEGITGSLLGTASYAVYSVSASFSETASYVNTLRQSVYISGSLITTGSNTLIGNTSLTGSLNVSGSTTQIGNNTLLGNTTLSGSIIISGSTTSPVTPTIKVYGDMETDGVIKFMPVDKSIDTSISASYIFVSGSTDDLYFSQNGAGYSNVTRLRWLEGNLYTGLLHGGVITTQSSTVYQISSGSGIIVNLNASLGDDPYPEIQFLQWGTLSASIAPLTASYQQAFVGIDATNNIFAQGTPFNNSQFDVIINIGNVLFQNQSTINGVKTQPSVAYGFEQQQNTFNRAFGPLKISGYTLAPSGSSTGSLIVGSGTSYAPGANYTVDPNEPYYVVDSGTNVSKIFRYHQSGSTWIYNTNAGAGFTTIDPGRYSNNGVLATVQPNDWSIQRVFWFPNSVAKAIVVYYGNQSYSTEADAIANISIESFVEAPNTSANAIYLGSIIIRGNGVLTTPADFTIVPGGLFRQVGGSGGGGSIVTQTLSGLSDVNISGPTNGQPLVYNTTAAKWQNQSTLTATLTGNASTATTASYAVTASYVNPLVQDVIITGSLVVSASGTPNDFQVGANKLFVSASGNVGIGTSSPPTKLTIQDTIGDPVRIVINDDTKFNRILFQKPSQTWSAGTINTNDFAIGDETAVAYRFRIFSGSANVQINPNGTGSVSIGTTVLGSAKLHINNTTTQNSLLIEDETNPDATPFVIDNTGRVGIGTGSAFEKVTIQNGNIALKDLTNSTPTSIVFTTSDTSSRNYITTLNSSSATDDYMKVGSWFGSVHLTTGNITSPTTHLFVSRSGNIGVGITSSLNAKLHVNNTGTENSFLVEDDTNPDATPFVIDRFGRVGIGTPTPTAVLHVSGNADSVVYEGVDHVYQEYFPQGISAGRFGYIGYGSSGSKDFRIYNESGDGRILLGTSGSTLDFRMSILGNGNVGIGITTPTAKLHVNNTSTSASFLVEDSANPDSTPFVIDNAGNVGIGTLSPISELTISASGVDGILLGTDTSAGNQEQSARLMFGSITASNTVTMFATSGSLNILTGGTPSVSSGTSRMFISSSGNVGIGTQTPTQPLQVAISGSSTIGGTNLSGSALLVGTINNGIGIDNNELYNAGNEFIIGTLGSNNISFRPNSTPRMVISSSGDVGIGITIPTAKLHVNNLNAGNSFLVEDSTNPDATPFVIDNVGNVGIGTTTPNARLDISGSTIITGSLNVTAGITASTFTTTDALITSTTTTINSGVTTIYNIPTASYDGAWFDYTIRSGSNARAGSIMGMWSGTAVNYAETTTTDFGNTSGFALGMSIVGANMILSSSATTNGWTFNAIIRSV
jgi:hypothetical protein